MVTTHKINRQLPAMSRRRPEIMALVARVRQDSTQSTRHSNNRTSTWQTRSHLLHKDHPVHAFLKKIHEELYTIENALDEQENLFLGAEESIDAKVVAL